MGSKGEKLRHWLKIFKRPDVYFEQWHLLSKEAPNIVPINMESMFHKKLSIAAQQSAAAAAAAGTTNSGKDVPAGNAGIPSNSSYNFFGSIQQNSNSANQNSSSVASQLSATGSFFASRGSICISPAGGQRNSLHSASSSSLASQNLNQSANSVSPMHNRNR